VGDKEKLKNLVNSGVGYATELGMYVIIDWHILADNDPNINKDEALKFFDEMSKKYKDYNNVLFEICNEPNGGTSWSSVETYAEEVIPVIKAQNKDAIIIVGTPTWSQDVDVAAKDPIEGYNNIMYTIHFYADTHRGDLRNKMKTALDAGLPVFCSEFSICDASGNGNNNISEANEWIKLLDEKGVSYCSWSLCNKAESSALISSTCNKKSGWSREDLSEAGQWYYDVLNERREGTKPENTTRDATTDIDNTDGNKKDNDKKDTDNSNTAVMDKTSGLSANVKVSNTWDTGSETGYQYDVQIENAGKESVDGWKIEITFSNDFKLDSGWCGKYDAKSKILTITPEDYNKVVEAKGSIKDIGFIITSKDQIDVVNVEILK